MDSEKLFDHEIECSILSDCLNNPGSIEQLLLSGVEKEDFYNSKNQDVYEAFIKTYSKHKTIDLVIVANENKNIPISYLTELLSGALRINLKAHINILINLSINRRYLKLAKEIQNGDIQDIGEFIRLEIDKINILKSRINSNNTLTTLDKIKTINIYEVEKIKTGFKEIDKHILGFVMGSLNVITGYNGNGKSTLINQMCIAESISQGYKVFAYSPELTNSNLKSWLYPTLAIEDHFITRDFYGSKYKVIGDIGIKLIDKWISDKLHIYTDDSITNSSKVLLRDMEYMALAKGVRVFIIDNLMKIEIEESYKNELLAQKIFVNELKEFAKKYKAIVHLVAHPRKPSEGNSGKINKFDVAGTGDITNLADYVMAVRRVSAKERMEDEESENPMGLKDSLVKVLKDRPKG
ncbi:MAG: AAA family ATPase, partial [Clostridiaceae bacterium]|nr:AAA family ATPase [Clostridiaceae bacterium]